MDEQDALASGMGRLSHGEEGFTLLGTDHGILFDSPGMGRISGFDPFARVGRPVSDFVHAQDWPRLRHSIGRVMLPSASSVAVIARWRKADGTWCWLETIAAYSPDLPAPAVMLTSRDVTRHVRQLSRERATLAAAADLAARGPNDLFGVLLEHAVAILAADGGTVYRWDPFARGLRLSQRSGVADADNDAEARLASASEPAGLAVERGTAVMLNRVQARGRIDTAILAAPLVHKGAILGAIALLRERAARPFEADEAKLLTSLLAVAAATLVGQGRARLQDTETMLDEVRAALTLSIGYTELLAAARELPRPLLEVAKRSLEASWRAATALKHLRQAGGM